MLSDEEKKAVNQLKADTNFYDYELKNGKYIYELFKIEVYKKDVDIILNLIEKQSKEIEELKNGQIDFWISDKEIEERIRKKFPVTITKEELIEQGREEVKDKIKAKIEEYDDKGITVNLANRSAEKTFQQAVHYEVKKVLQSLLEKE